MFVVAPSIDEAQTHIFERGRDPEDQYIYRHLTSRTQITGINPAIVAGFDEIQGWDEANPDLVPVVERLRQILQSKSGGSEGSAEGEREG